MKNVVITLMSLLTLSLACKEQKEEVQEVSQSSVSEAIFPKGQKGPADFFTGNAYNYGLVAADSLYTTLVGNVFFEPGARSHWHSHPAGQILLVTSGIGYHQIEGQARETIQKGDVIQCPPNTKHWHGASKDRSMTHIYILPNTELGIVEWMDPVTDEQYLGN